MVADPTGDTHQQFRAEGLSPFTRRFVPRPDPTPEARIPFQDLSHGRAAQADSAA